MYNKKPLYRPVRRGGFLVYIKLDNYKTEKWYYGKERNNRGAIFLRNRM